MVTTEMCANNIIAEFPAPPYRRDLTRPSPWPDLSPCDVAIPTSGRRPMLPGLPLKQYIYRFCSSSIDSLLLLSFFSCFLYIIYFLITLLPLCWLWNFLYIFSVYWIGNLIRILKMHLKQSFSYSKLFSKTTWCLPLLSELSTFY